MRWKAMQFPPKLDQNRTETSSLKINTRNNYVIVLLKLTKSLLEVKSITSILK